jgi:hypothetical protein
MNRRPYLWWVDRFDAWIDRVLLSPVALAIAIGTVCALILSGWLQ